MGAGYDLTRRYVEAINAQDAAALRELYAPDAEHVVAAEHPEARTCHGIEEIEGYLREWGLEDVDFAVTALTEAEGHGLAEGRLRASVRDTGVPLDVYLAFLVTPAGGRIARVEEFLDSDAARAALAGRTDERAR
jgi:ketosteroid isomerase-like protein